MRRGVRTTAFDVVRIGYHHVARVGVELHDGGFPQCERDAFRDRAGIAR